MTICLSYVDDDREKQIARLFDLENLSDGLTSGRLCDVPVDDATAQLILILLERLDWAPDAHALVTAFPHYPDQVGLAEVRATLANLGYASTIASLPGHRLKHCAPATVVCDETGMLWLLGDDGDGPILFQANEISKSKRPAAMVIYRTIQFEQPSPALQRTTGSPNRSWTADLFNRFGSEKKLLVFSTLASGVAAIVVAFGISKIFDTVIPTESYATLMGLLIGLAIIALPDFVLRGVRASAVGRVAGRVEYLLSTGLFSKIMRLPSSMVTSASQSDQFARLKQFETLRDVVGGPVVLLFLELIFGSLLLLAVAVIAWQLAALLFVLAGVFLASAFLLTPRLRRATQRLSVAQSAMNELKYELLASRQQIRRAGLFEVSKEKLNSKLREVVRARRKLNQPMRLPQTLAHASLPLAASSVIGAGALLAMAGSITTGQLIAATILTWRLFAPIQQSLSVLPKVPDILRLNEQIDMLMRLPEEASSPPTSLSLRPKGELVASNVVMRYPNGFKPALVVSKLQIPPGAFVTVTGHSGSGKSTLLRLLAGTIAPQAGVVLLDGLNLVQLSRAFRTRSIVYVSQKPVFFFGTLAQNLRLAAPGIHEDKLTEVLQDLGLARWVDTLPDGLHTRIDPATSTLLNPTIKTLLSIAQALLVEPRILLLDETVGGLEPEFEANLLEALRKRRADVSVVMVTHRPSLIRQSDFAIVLNEGAATMQQVVPQERVAS